MNYTEADFKVGTMYYTYGASTEYRCVYVGKTFVVFDFIYQSRTRAAVAYYHEMKPYEWDTKKISYSMAKSLEEAQKLTGSD